MDTNVTDRIKKFLELKNISAGQFADEIGIARARVSHILTGRNNPSLEIVQALLIRYPEINAGWVLFGKDTAFFEELSKDATTNNNPENTVNSESKINLFNYQSQTTAAAQTIKETKKPEIPEQLKVSINNEPDVIEEIEQISENNKEGLAPGLIRTITVFYDNNRYENFISEKMLK